jgi:serine/threonine-protein kinase
LTTLDRDRWRRLDEVFTRALELPRTERPAFVRRACAGDPELAGEVEAMLAAHESPEVPALERRLLDDDDGAAPADPWVGRRLGAWRLVELLGEGGSGRVYLADRADRHYRQRAAVKLLAATRLSERSLVELRRERQLLARLRHPGIVPLLDGGVSPEGLPYLVMQWVDGEPITDYCTRLGLSVEERIELFRAVCDAVAYAHARLVVHRDLKPSNILVDREGRPQLLDFGIAKLLEPDRLGVEAEAPTVAARYTPEYASPEQVTGGSVTTATDVYALGLLLQELLVGRPVRRFSRLSLGELVTSVAEAPPPPSVAVLAPPEGEKPPGAEERKLSRRLAGDLDTIVATALHPDPGRRYGSARELAEDLGRHLDGLPVRARDDSFAYRAGKLVRRYPLGFGASAAFLLLLVVFAGFMVWQSRALARERDLARSERDKARQVTGLLVDLFDADPYAYEEERLGGLTVRDFLARSESRVRDGLEGQPAVRAGLLGLLARLYGKLGRLDPAEELAREAFAELRALHRRGHPEVTDAELADGADTLATVLQFRGEWEEAEELFRRALELRLALYGETHLDVADSLNNLAALLGERRRPGDRAAIEELDLRALEIRRRLLGPRHLEVAQSLNNLAVFYYGRDGPGDPEQAEGLYRQALAIRRDQLPPRHPSIANTESNLANVLQELGRFDEAEVLFRSAVDSWSASLGPEHPRVATGLFGLYGLLRERGRLREAEEALRRSRAIDLAALPGDHPYLADEALALGRLVLEQGRAEEAEPLLREALDRARRVGDEPARGVPALHALGRCLLELGRAEEASRRVAEARRAHDQAAERSGGSAPAAELLAEQHRLEKAVAGAGAGW